jgi:hypothetical protein
MFEAIVLVCGGFLSVLVLKMLWALEDRMNGKDNWL